MASDDVRDAHGARGRPVRHEQLAAGRGIGRDEKQPSADDLDSPPTERMGVASWSTSDVEHALAWVKTEQADEEVDFLFGALGERVAQVGASEMIGDVLEPVIAWHQGSTLGVGPAGAV